MRNFFDRYSYSIVKMFVHQFALGLFGAVLAMATTKNLVLSIVVGVFSIAFYLFLIYTVAWDIGAKDKISIDCGKLKPRPYLGILLSLAANIPNFIIAILYSIFRLVFAENDNAAAIIRTVAFYIEGMYQGIMSKIIIGTHVVDGAEVGIRMFEHWWSYFVIIIPAVAVTGIAYWLGMRNALYNKMMEYQYPESDREPKKKWFGRNKNS